MPADLVGSFVAFRVLPLFDRPHRICDKGFRKDPCRLSSIDLELAKIAGRVTCITNFKL